MAEGRLGKILLIKKKLFDCTKRAVHDISFSCIDKNKCYKKSSIFSNQTSAPEERGIYRIITCQLPTNRLKLLKRTYFKIKTQSILVTKKITE